MFEHNKFWRHKSLWKLSGHPTDVIEAAGRLSKGELIRSSGLAYNKGRGSPGIQSSWGWSKIKAFAI